MYFVFKYFYLFTIHFLPKCYFFCQQSIELQHLCTQFEYLNSLPSLLSLAEGFSGECLKFSIWGRAGDAAVPSRQGSTFSALLLPSAGPGSAAALISLIPLPLAPRRASPGYRLARTWGICQILWQSHRVFLICHNKRDAPSQKSRGVVLKRPAHCKKTALENTQFYMHWVRIQRPSVGPLSHSYYESKLWSKIQLPAWMHRTNLQNSPPLKIKEYYVT